MKYELDTELAPDFKPSLGDIFIDRDITSPDDTGTTRNIYVLSQLKDVSYTPNSIGYLATDGSHQLFFGTAIGVATNVEDAFKKLSETIEIVIGKNYYPNDISTVKYLLQANTGSIGDTTESTTEPPVEDTTTTTTLNPDEINDSNLIEALMSVRLGLRMAHEDYLVGMNADSRYDFQHHMESTHDEIKYASNLLTRVLMQLNAGIDYDSWDGSDYSDYLPKNIQVDTSITNHFPNNAKDDLAKLSHKDLPAFPTKLWQGKETDDVKSETNTQRDD